MHFGPCHALNGKFDISRNLSTFPSQLHSKASWSFATQSHGHEEGFGGLSPSETKLCCDRKSRAACAQSFAPWQQATIEITRRDHSIIPCLRHIHNGVILHAHPVRGESHNQRNTTGEVATTSPPFYKEPHRSHVLCVKAELRTTFTSWSQHHFVDVSLTL